MKKLLLLLTLLLSCASNKALQENSEPLNFFSTQEIEEYFPELATGTNSSEDNFVIPGLLSTQEIENLSESDNLIPVWFFSNIQQLASAATALIAEQPQQILIALIFDDTQQINPVVTALVAEQQPEEIVTALVAEQQPEEIVTALVAKQQSEENKKKFKCTYPSCNKTFSHKGNLTVHTKIHIGEQPFQCDLCHKRFNRKSNLKGHIMIAHTKEQPFQCSECLKRFKHKNYLKRHVGIQHKK